MDENAINARGPGIGGGGVVRDVVEGVSVINGCGD